MNDTAVITRPISAYMDTRAAGDDEFTRTFVATTAGVKRDGLDIDLAGMSTENFLRNPVFLWVHDYWGERLPIGTVTKIRTLKSKMTVKVLFDQEDEFAMEVLRKYDKGFLNAVSIGWDTIEFDREERRVVESDLLDVSGVPVPGDPDALIQRQRSLLRSLGQDLLDRFDFEVCPVESDEGWICTAGQADHLGQHEYVTEISGDGSGAALPPFHDAEQSVTFSPLREIEPTEPDADGTRWRQYESRGLRIVINGKIDQEKDLIRKISEAISDRQRSDGLPNERPSAEHHDDAQEGDQMERLEELVKTLDAFRAALSALIDSADVDDTDESLATLLAAFPGVEPAVDGDDDKGEEE